MLLLRAVRREFDDALRLRAEDPAAALPPRARRAVDSVRALLDATGRAPHPLSSIYHCTVVGVAECCMAEGGGWVLHAFLLF